MARKSSGESSISSLDFSSVSLVVLAGCDGASAFAVVFVGSGFGLAVPLVLVVVADVGFPGERVLEKVANSFDRKVRGLRLRALRRLGLCASASVLELSLLLLERRVVLLVGFGDF